MTKQHPAGASPSTEADASFAAEDHSSASPANSNSAPPLAPPPPVAPPPESDFTEACGQRHDGWTPHRKRLFLDAFSQCGVVTHAVRATGMSAQSAYDLRNRDPLFAAGWAAAIHLVRQRVADDALARSLEGVVEPVYYKGVVVGERRRYDNRLALGLLHRLDRIAERDEDRGAGHPRAAARWGEYLDAIGEDRGDDARALLDPAKASEIAAEAEPAKHAPEHQVHQVSLRAQTEEEEDPMTEDRHLGVWQDADGRGATWTDYPAPEGFTGREVGRYGTDDYKRALTEEEAAIHLRDMEACRAERHARGEAQRMAYFYGELIEEEPGEPEDAAG